MDEISLTSNPFYGNILQIRSTEIINCVSEKCHTSFPVELFNPFYGNMMQIRSTEIINYFKKK